MAIKKFDNNAVENLICDVVPFLDKGQAPERAEPSALAKRIYLMNLPYDATALEVEKLCREFAPIEKVSMPRDT